MKKNAKNAAKRGKKLSAGKKLQKTKTLTTLQGPTESFSLNFDKIEVSYKPQN